MLQSFINPNFLILSTLLLGMFNLLVPFLSKIDSFIRIFLLTTISILFFINVLIIDWLFLYNININISLLRFGDYIIAFNIEPLGLIFLNLLSFLWIYALIYTNKYLVINNIGDSSRFLFFLNFSIMVAIYIALSANIFTMFVFYEILTLSTAPLIVHTGGSQVMVGLYKYLKILMITSMLLFLPAMLIIYVKVGHGNFLADGFIEHYFSKNQTIILLLMFIFGIAKVALYPFHQWLPAAMVATFPVSALLHAVVVVKTGLFCVYKILIYIFGLKYLHSIFIEFNWLIFLPSITIIYSAFKALQTDNIKKILAYSTINQLNIALLSAFMFTPKAMGAAILHMVSHSFTKICLFYGTGNIYSLKHTNQAQDLLGISKEMPKTSFIILIASLSLIGLPPFSGFISKVYIMIAAIEQNQILVIIILILSTFFSALYIIRLLIFLYKPIDNCNSRSYNFIEDKLPTSMLISLTICCFSVVLYYFIQIFIKKFLFYL